MMYTVYTLKGCWYCEEAKKVLSTKKLPFKEVEVQRNSPELEALVQRNNYHTFPQIFLNNVFIGGFRELTDILDKK